MATVATVTLPLFTRVGDGELIEIGTFDIPITVGEGVKTEILRGVREATSIDTDTIKDGHGHTVRTYVKGGEPETVVDAGQLAERIKDWRNHFVELRPYGTKEHSGIIKRPEGMTDTEWEAYTRGVAAGAQLMHNLLEDHGPR